MGSSIGRITICVGLLASGLSSSFALAADDSEAGLVLPPGRWLFDVSILMPMQSTPAEQSLQTCSTGEPITAEMLMPWAEDQGCRIQNVEVEDNELTWKLRCRMNGQRSRGSGQFSVDGDEGEGEARVSFDMAGRRMSIRTSWKARRIGECSDAARTAPTSTNDGEDEDEDEEG